MEDILSEVRTLKEEGYREITLLGQNVNAYGKDLGIEGGFARLLEETAKIGIDRIRFTTSHPWDFSDEMIVLKDFSSAQMDGFLAFFRENQIPPVALKAMLTPVTQHWSSIQLHDELSREHTLMHKK